MESNSNPATYHFYYVAEVISKDSNVFIYIFLYFLLKRFWVLVGDWLPARGLMYVLSDSNRPGKT